MKILAIDGGGIRGYFSAHILKRIQDEYKIKYSDVFGLICGTSTGAIIASCLALDIDLELVCDLYKNKSKNIFTTNNLNVFRLLRSKYNINNLKKELEKIFRDTKLKDSKTRLLLTSTDLINANVHIFKSPYLDDYVRDRNVLITDAILASCAAPTYFQPVVVNPYMLADGGLWANNPSLAGLIEAWRTLKMEIDNIQLLSIGTGIGDKYFSMKRKNSGWGILTGWGIGDIIDVLFNLQSKSAENMVSMLINETNYIRLNFTRANKLLLDDLKLLEDLESTADNVFTQNAKKIRTLLGV